MKIIARNQKGATAVEFALLLPLLLLVPFGIIEFSLLLYNKAMLTNACREGARFGVNYRWPSRIDHAEIENVVLDYCDQWLVTFGSSVPATEIYEEDCTTVAPDDDPPCQNFNNSICVKVTFQYDFLFLPYSGVDLDSETLMRCE